DQHHAVFFQLHVADDVGTDGTGRVRERGATKAGMEFVGDSGATHLGAALQHERLESRFGEVEGGDEAVVPAADDEDVAFSGCVHRMKVRAARGERLVVTAMAERVQGSFDSETCSALRSTFLRSG